MIYITGDVHGEIDICKFSSKEFPEGKELTSNDFIIITGDFGLIWDVNYSKESESYWIKWLSEKPWTTLFIDGNHENFDRLNTLPIEEKFGGKVGKINDKIYHLKRGEIYTIENKTFFCFGGAQSIDKNHRIEFLSWWKEEIPNTAEIQNGLNNLAKVNNKVDYIITHTCPEKILAKNIFHLNAEKIDDQTGKILNTFYSIINFKHWYFGHFHTDIKLSDKFTVLYYDKIKI